MKEGYDLKKKERNKNGLLSNRSFSPNRRLCRGLEMKRTFKDDLFRETI